MGKLISIFTLGMQYFPFVMTGVAAVEQAMPTAPGATKKAAVLSAIDAAAKIGETVPEAHVQIISTLIDALVTALNATGWFNHAAAKPAV